MQIVKEMDQEYYEILTDGPGSVLREIVKRIDPEKIECDPGCEDLRSWMKDVGVIPSL